MSDLPRMTSESGSSYRIGASINDELMKGQRSRVPVLPGGITLSLPEPVFQQNPKLYAASRA